MPLDVEPFIKDIIQLMKDKLHLLNQGLRDQSNEKVAITTRNNKGWIRVTPLEKQPEPPHVTRIKQEIKNRWSDINLLDLLKETDFHTEFTKHFKTTADREILDRETVQRRLLLSLFGLGTNTGLKTVFRKQARLMKIKIVILNIKICNAKSKIRIVILLS